MAKKVSSYTGVFSHPAREKTDKSRKRKTDLRDKRIDFILFTYSKGDEALPFRIACAVKMVYFAFVTDYIRFMA
ncbi:MAG: hypothetical protein IJL30_07920 [Clostridia bacterium]|nr:hypothetical protein [Clostridia bacterium]